LNRVKVGDVLPTVRVQNFYFRVYHNLNFVYRLQVVTTV
jgi:hypothetical protein